MLRTNDVGQTTNNNIVDRAPQEQLAEYESRQPEGTSTDETVDILADVLRVFAARGRAIREERARRNMLQLESVPAVQENSMPN